MKTKTTEPIINAEVHRARLALKVYEAVLGGTASFEDASTGSLLAYLMGAILKGPAGYAKNVRNGVDLHVEDPDQVGFAHLLRTLALPSEVGGYLLFRDSDNKVLTGSVKMDDISRCILSGDHLRNCDEDGYCNACGEQEGAEWVDALSAVKA